MIDELIADAEERMRKAVEALRAEFATIRTGRASPSILDRVTVDYYGTPTSLRQLANTQVSDARSLVVTPYDKSAMKQIERAIMESDLGLTPSSDGKVIRLQIPELTAERRRDLVKVVRGIAEEGRIAIRNIRRDTNQDLRELKAEGEVGSDEEHRAEGELQKVTDSMVALVDESLGVKEAEILEV